MVELVCGLHHVSSDGYQGKFLSGGTSAFASPREFKGGGAKSWASPWMSRSDYRCHGVVKLVMELHHGSPRVVRLEVGFHQGCFIREQEVSRGSEASDGTSPPKMQEDEVHDGTSP